MEPGRDFSRVTEGSGTPLADVVAEIVDRKPRSLVTFVDDESCKNAQSMNVMEDV